MLLVGGPQSLAWWLAYLKWGTYTCIGYLARGWARSATRR